jgi:hypothetical protein
LRGHAHAANLFQRIHPQQQRGVGRVRCRQRIEVGHRLVVHRLHDVEAVHLVQFVAEIAEHEADHVLGLFLPAFGGLLRDQCIAARDHRADRQYAGHGHHDQRQRGDRRHAAGAALQFALPECIETDAEHARDQFEFGVGFAVLVFASVGRDRLGAFAGRFTIRIELETQRRTEAFVCLASGHLARVRLAADDQAEDALGTAHALVGEHFLVDPARCGRGRRANDDQVFGSGQRCIDCAAEVRGAGQFFAVAEHRRETARNDTGIGLLTDQSLRHAIRLQRLVQPVSPRLVTMAIADERAIGDPGTARRIRHARPTPLGSAVSSLAGIPPTNSL